MPRKRPDFVAAVKHGIRAEMASRDWSAYDLADASGVSPKHVYRIINGEQSPSMDVVQKILRALGKTLVMVDESSVRQPR